MKANKYENIWESIRLELFTLKKMKGISWIILIAYLVIVLMFSSSFTFLLSDMNKNTYFFFQQTAICLLSLIGFVPIVLGSKILWDDMHAGMLQLKISMYGRNLVFLSKLVSSVFFQFAFSFIPCILALIYDWHYENNGEIFTVIEVFLIIQFFYNIWCFLSMAITYLCKSSFIATGFLICIFYLESFFAQYIPINIIKWFPMWNQKSILHQYFPNPEGIIAVIQKGYNTKQDAYKIILFYFLVIFLSFMFQFLKKDIKEEKS